MPQYSQLSDSLEPSGPPQLGHLPDGTTGSAAATTICVLHLRQANWHACARDVSQYFESHVLQTT